MVDEPTEYVFTSSGAAMSGDRITRDGIQSMYQRKVSWNGALSAYRVLLFGKGAQA